jgi:hypothetical protein
VSHLSDYQVSFGGLTIGDGTEYDISEEEGIESFEVRDSDVPFPNQWGSIAGVDEVNGRTIRLDVEIAAADDPALAYTFESAFLPSSDDEFGDLVAKFPGRDDVYFRARVRKRTRRRIVDEVLGVVKIGVELFAPDPRAYSFEEFSEAIPAYSSGSEAFELSSGSGANLAFDLTESSGADLAFEFTGVPAQGDVVLVNDGNVDTYPEIVFTPAGAGALETYRVSNVTTGVTATFTATVSPGQTLTADMAMIATPKAGLPISLDGESRYGFWSQPRTPLALAPGNNTIRFEVLSGTSDGAIATVTWRNAWL